MSDDAAHPAAGLELAREGGHLGLEPGGRGRGLGQVLMRQRERQVVGDAACEVDVVLGEAIDLARREEERPEHAGAERQWHAHRRAGAEPEEPPALGAAAAELLVGVVHNVRIAIEQPGALRFAELNRRPEIRILRGGPGHGVHT